MHPSLRTGVTLNVTSRVTYVAENEYCSDIGTCIHQYYSMGFSALINDNMLNNFVF